MAREEGIECFSSFMMDILNMRERDMKPSSTLGLSLQE